MELIKSRRRYRRYLRARRRWLINEQEKTKSLVNEVSCLSFNGEYISRRNRGKFTQRYSEEQDKDVLLFNRVKAGV